MPNKCTRVLRLCEQCGTEFLFLACPSNVALGRGRFCSTACAHIYTRNDPKRFWARVDRGAGPRACWPWRYGKDDDGYGVIMFAGRQRRAHRVAFFLANGHWPEPCCLHTCDTPACCNPAHLVEGTNLENIQDRDRKGHTARGEQSGMAKLTTEQVIEIRKRRAHEGISPSALAAHYGVSEALIYAVVQRKIWRHVE